MPDENVIMWEGVPIKNLSREELYEVILHLMIEQKYWVYHTLNKDGMG